VSAREEIIEVGRSQTHVTPRGIWSIAAKHARPGGDIDVILKFTAASNKVGRHYGYRYDAGAARWTQLAGTWLERRDAIHAVARETRAQVLAYRDLVPLLCIAAALTDFPDAVTGQDREA
jgi:hypothetical protein